MRISRSPASMSGASVCRAVRDGCEKVCMVDGMVGCLGAAVLLGRRFEDPIGPAWLAIGGK